MVDRSNQAVLKIGGIWFKLKYTHSTVKEVNLHRRTLSAVMPCMAFRSLKRRAFVDFSGALYLKKIGRNLKQKSK